LKGGTRCTREETDRSAIADGRCAGGCRSLEHPHLGFRRSRRRSGEDPDRAPHATHGFSRDRSYASWVRSSQPKNQRSGGILGKQIDLLSEDSINPPLPRPRRSACWSRTARWCLLGEISSASRSLSCRSPSATRRCSLDGARSDALAQNCNKYSFHCDIPNTVMVNAVALRCRRRHGEGQEVLHAHAVTSSAIPAQGRQDLLRRPHAANLIATADRNRRHRLQPLSLKVRQANPTWSAATCRHQVTNLVKQYAEFGLPYPLVGFNLNTGDAWAQAPAISAAPGDGLVHTLKIRVASLRRGGSARNTASRRRTRLDRLSSR